MTGNDDIQKMDDYVEAELIEQPAAAAPQQVELPALTAPPRVRRRRTKLPLVLFLITCVSVFWSGALGWLPSHYLEQWYFLQDAMPLRRAMISHWQDGLIFMLCLLGILLTHEMGHFLAAWVYRIPASLPYFLPFPISPWGTMGAVIGMESMRADRKQVFDIGLAGPLAGLLVAVPVLWIGLARLDLSSPEHGPYKLEAPLSVRLVLETTRPEGYESGDRVWWSQLNPYFMAGWVGLLITGLNMLPVSQLDGGHVIYALFGRHSRWIARGFMLAAVVYLIATGIWDRWVVMVVLVLLIGTDHPPTRDDTVKLGWIRIGLGLLSLLIPVLCFPPHVLDVVK
jgi:membrane-associated protease RseP (regulator of RpoE activity)